MDYYFNGSVNTMKTANYGDLTLLFNNGTALLSYSSTYSNFNDYKMELDYYSSNQSRNYNLGYFYGYSYFIDDNLFISLNTNCTYFAVGLRDDVTDVILNSYVYDYFDAGSFHYKGYNNQLLSPISSFYIDSGNNTNNAFFYDSYYDLVMSYVDSNPNSFSNLFDYRLSSNKDTYYIRGEDYDFYMGSFSIACEANAPLVITSGVDTTLNEEYERGYSSGLKSGTAQGREEGYAQGKADGIAQGRLEVGNYSSAMDFVGNGITQLTPIFGLEILPNITLGTVISIPIIIGVLSIIFRISKG